MTSASKIEWTGHTWNPIVGCTILSPGCTNCYAMKDACRKGFNPKVPHYHGLTKLVNGHPVWTGDLHQAPESVLLAPLKRKKPTTYFVNSMSDLFHESIPDEWIDKIFAVMALCPQHTFQVLTKRAGRMRSYVENARRRVIKNGNSVEIHTPKAYHASTVVGGEKLWPLPNVWLGVSAERQKEADERVPHLLRTPAAVRFISAEPLLNPIDLRGYMKWLTRPGNAIDWVIVGGESGLRARPMHPDWARSLRDQCSRAGVAFFFKQWGSWLPLEEDASTWGREWFLISRDGVDDIPDGRVPMYDEGEYAARRVGKKNAGRLLDGIEHNAMPEALT